MVVVNVLSVQEAAQKGLLGGYRPLRVNKKTGLVQFETNRGVTINSLLREDEWAEIDRTVQRMSRYPLRVVNDLRSEGLVKKLGGLGSLVSQWYSASEMSAASVNMTGRSRSERDLPELKQAGVPVPVVFKEFSVGQRMLLASRALGEGIDTTAAGEAARVVAEGLEGLAVNGGSVVLGAASLYGLTSHTGRITDTAANYGGGDWGTLANVVATVAGMINAANAARYYGPFYLYVSQTQYNQAALAFYTDGSGETAIERIKKLPQIKAVKDLPSDTLADGAVLLVQMTEDNIDYVEAVDIESREWVSGDEMEANFKVLAVGATRLKGRYDGKVGVIHATGA